MNAYFGRKNIYTENKNVYSTGKNWINIFLDQIMLLYFFHIWIGNTNQEQKQFWIYLEFLVLIVTLLLFFFPVVTFGVRVLPKYYGNNKLAKKALKWHPKKNIFIAANEIYKFNLLKL